MAVPVILAACGDGSQPPPSEGPGAPSPFEPDRTATRWAPYVEWSLRNSTYSGNPFDLVASVTFAHDSSGERRVTEMFYDGNDVWRFRFTATRTGTWNFTTSSADPDLDGRRGTVKVAPDPDPGARGFLSRRGDKFAQQTSSGTTEAVLFRPFADASNEVAGRFGCDDYEDMTCWSEDFIRAYARKARRHGMSHIFLVVAHQWFVPGIHRHDRHDERNPSPRSFRILERAIEAAREEGVGVHMWAWGDEQRKMTPRGLPGGINGEVDRRLQRYIAARLGPLPGWTLGYGFDLGEWVRASEADSWARFQHEHMGWDHLLWARNLKGPHLDVESVGGPGPSGYAGARDHVNPTKPHLEEERFLYGRTFGGTTYTMDHTLDLMWWMAMAGGSAGFWGTRDDAEYPRPAWLRTYARFWRDRLRFDMAPADSLGEGHVLASSDDGAYVFYQEDAASVELDLSTMASPRHAVAVDARAPYRELDLGTLEPRVHTWKAPRRSDWAVAVGDSGGRAAAASGQPGEK